MYNISRLEMKVQKMFKKTNPFIIGFILCIMPLIATAYDLTLMGHFKDHEGIGPEMTLIDSSWVISSISGRKKVWFNSTEYELDAEFKIVAGKNAAVLYHLKTPIIDVTPIKRARLTNAIFNDKLYSLKESLFVSTSFKSSKIRLGHAKREFYNLSDLKCQEDLRVAWKKMPKDTPGGGLFIKDRANDQYELVGLIGKDFMPIKSFSLNALIDNIMIAYALG